MSEQESIVYNRPELSRLLTGEAGQLALRAAEDVIFDELDRLTEPLGLPVQKEYHPLDLKRLGIAARWGGPTPTTARPKKGTELPD